MASRYAAILAQQNEEDLTEVIPETISDIPETSNCYFMVYDGPYLLTEGSLCSIKYKLPLVHFDRPIKVYQKNSDHPRIVTIRL